MKSRELFSTNSFCKPQNNSFYDASKVGDAGVRDLLPLLEQKSFQGRFVFTDKGELAPFLQKTVGDVVLNCDKGKIWAVEIKTEQKDKYGTFFLETWSNRSRLTHGWMHTLKTDFLWYYFQEDGLLYSIYFPKLQEWAFMRRRIYQFPERKQGKYEQLNDTWGASVPITIIEREVGFKKFIKGAEF